MTIIFLRTSSNSKRGHGHKLHTRVGRGNSYGRLLSWHREIIACTSITAFILQFLFFQRSWLSALLGDNNDINIETGLASLERSILLPPCPPIDTQRLRDGLVCVQKCTPSANNTIEGLGLDLNERLNISHHPSVIRVPVTEYGKYQIHFPEENNYLNLTGRLAAEINRAVENAKGTYSILDNGYLQPRPVTERLLRRIVAKLLRHDLLDPSKSILTTGSWIGDNALPWANMLQHLRPENPGKVISVDPSEIFVKDMVDLANVNGIGNLCARIGVLSKSVTEVAYLGSSPEHIKVETKESLAKRAPKLRAKYRDTGSWISSFTLDSLELQDGVSLLHLDVEGHEGELLEGASETIQSFRPVIITEGFNIWPSPRDENDKHVLAVMKALNYTFASEIPEYCGLKKDARNRIWWPDGKTRDAAMAIIGKELERSIVPWMAFNLPDI